MAVRRRSAVAVPCEFCGRRGIAVAISRIGAMPPAICLDCALSAVESLLQAKSHAEEAAE